ncbi:NAD dependent epimerase/dehydratase family [Musa troglodytarum]|uniref:NAD dependent epimerase/dehydratase family n=1 Tax=Musa troglodytarum TaxID=320322 RepID=A0A9E7FS06_9LILI|nr:NAD dependent epimerase/dehydratase family [Musa troglodytarum]
MSLWSFASAPALPSRRPPSLSTRSIPSPRSLSRSPSRPPSRVNVRCSYATSDMVEDSSSLPIDVVADVKTEKIVVLGGNGFVGSAICKAAALKGIEVVSEVLVGATAVVSTLGGLGNEEQMKRINGEANILAVGAAKDFGVPKFVLISVHDYNLPSFILSSGYFIGKRKAESEVLSKYPRSGVVLRPGFIYGKKKVDGYEIPLDLIGEPLERLLLAAENFTRPLKSLPASDLLLAPPVSVDDVAYAVINALMDDDFFGVFTIEQIKEAAAKEEASACNLGRSGWGKGEGMEGGRSLPLSRRDLAAAAVVLAIFGVGLAGLYLSMPASDYSFLKLPRTLEDIRILRDNLESYTNDYTVQVLICYFTTFMIPGTVFMSILAGALFGVAGGMVLVILAATAGASSCYFLSKIIGRPLVFSLWPDKLSFFQAQVAKRREKLLNYILFLRVTPTLPNTFINMASPIVDVPYPIFFLATLIGLIPAAYVTVRAGTALGELKSVADLYDFQSIATLFFIGIVTVTPTLISKGQK